jgi:hypothetical protein
MSNRAATHRWARSKSRLAAIGRGAPSQGPVRQERSGHPNAPSVGKSAFALGPVALVTHGHEHHAARFSAIDDLKVAVVVTFTPPIKALPEMNCLLVVGATSAISCFSKRREPTGLCHLPAVDHIQSSQPMSARWLELCEQDLKNTNYQIAFVARWVLIDYQGAQRTLSALHNCLQTYIEAGVSRAGGIVVYQRE